MIFLKSFCVFIEYIVYSGKYLVINNNHDLILFFSVKIKLQLVLYI